MPSYKLNYFNGRGRAELTRLIFAAAGAEYNDNRLTFEQWPTLKPEAPTGQMPFLEVDNQKIPQSISIARFVAREFNLAGKNNLEQAQADAIVDTLLDLVNYYYKNIYGIADANEKAEAFKKFLSEQGTKGATDIERLITMYGSNGFAVGSDLTWADLAIFDVTWALISKLPDFAKNFPKLYAIHDKVANHPKIAEYVKSRPETPF